MADESTSQVNDAGRTNAEVQPLVFISHRHHDREIAAKVADWLKVATNGNVHIFLSSDGLQGAQVARSITDQIREKVAEASVMFTIYTDEDADWAWVMFEMGIAMDPKTPVTKVVVLQCGDEAPAILPDFKRVQVSVEDDRVGLARDLYQVGFFPTHPTLKLGGAQADDSVVRAQASKLWESLRDLVPPTDAPRKQWYPFPWVRIEVPLSAIGARWPVDKDRMEGFRLPIKQEGRIVHEDAVTSLFAAQTFRGKNLVDLESVLALHDQHEWIDSCVDHLAHCLVDSRPTTAMRVVRGLNGGEYVPLVQRIQHKWFDRAFRFDVMFIPANLTAVAHSERRTRSRKRTE